MDQLTWNNDKLWSQFISLCIEDPSAVAVVDTEQRQWSRGEVRQRADEIAAKLVDSGVSAGKRVLVIGHQTVGTVAAALAVSKLNAIICPLAPTLSVADAVTIEERLGHAAKVSAPHTDLPTIEVREPASHSADPRDLDAVLIGFTSGTTGVPKAVMHGATALNYVTRAIAATVGLAVREPILAIIPLDSAAGYTLSIHFAQSLGHPLVFLGKWNPVTALELLHRYHCKWTTMVPTQLFTILEAIRVGSWRGKVSLRAISVGGAVISPDLIADTERLLGVTALRMFGMSECMAHASARLGDPRERRLTFDGRPFPDTDIEVFDSQLSVLPRLSRGEAGVRGPALFLGYSEGLGAGQERISPGGFYLTGDEMVRDDEGFVRVVGRFKDQIIRGGFNIDPAEIETVLLRHPAIAETAVVAVPDRKFGEQACAVCRIWPGFPEFDLKALLDHLADAGVSRKKWPEHLVVVEAMQFLPIGKVDKKTMAKLAVTELARRRVVTGG